MVSAMLSEWLGWLSIASWLGAQFPQVIENYKRQSVDGLALPFLANWLFGDITNLIGCILTHQLPFQTYLASYFVVVDFSLLAQYYYYTALRPSPKARRIEHDASRSHEREASHYRTLSVVAAHVAASAALAAQQEEARSRRNTIDHSPHTSRRRPSEHIALASDAEEEELPEESLTALTDSFMSEQTGRVRRKNVSWSDDRYASVGPGISVGPSRGAGPHQHAPLSPIASPDAFDYEAALAAVARGRSLSITRAEGDRDEAAAQRRNSRASKRGSAVVFLGVWALFGVGTMSMAKRGSSLRSPLHDGRVGRVLGADNIPPTDSMLSHGLPPEVVMDGNSTMVPATLNDPTPPSEPVSMERLIGRISAWMCTTLYLTSRLPQIWKNFVRKSVEGLSIALFVFAFLGNTFYVGSILTAPSMSASPEEAFAFLKESLPYLLGSGGTLIFDVTIVCQSLLYRKRPSLRPRGRGRMSANRVSREEETGLLDAEQGDLGARI